MVHIHAEGPAFFCWIPKLFGKRVINTIHGLDWDREKWRGSVASKFIRGGEKNAVKYADEIIVLSKDVQKYFLDTNVIHAFMGRVKTEEARKGIQLADELSDMILFHTRVCENGKKIDDGVERKFDCIIVASMYYCGPDFPAARQAIKETLYETGVDLIVLEEGLDTRTVSRKEVEDYFEEKRCEMHAEIMFAWRKKQGAGFRLTNYTIAPVILWDSTRVWKILTAYVYTGAMVLGKSQRLISGKSISRTVPKGQQYITEGTHEAIVSREEFEKAQLVINNRNKVVMGSVDFPLKGKVRCGNCRRAMGYDYKQTSPIFWCREGQELIGQTKCSSEIFQANDIENAVFQALKKELSLLGSLYGDIKKEEQSLKEASRKASRRKTSMEQELKNLKGEKMRMYEEYAAGTRKLP